MFLLIDEEGQPSVVEQLTEDHYAAADDDGTLDIYDLTEVSEGVVRRRYHLTGWENVPSGDEL